jgi:hypothetical protein
MIVADRVSELLAVAPDDRDRGWIHDTVNAAIALELATIPPYLCAWWSIRDDRDPAAIAIQEIVFQEMSHMALMANLQNAIGGTPVIRGAAPKYPTHLPGHVREPLTVYLAGLTRDYLRDVLMEIEMPEKPLARALVFESFPTIGAFYDALSAALTKENPPIDASKQLERRTFGVTILRSLDDALKAIAKIKGEGEGSTTDAFFDGRPAHYYRFGEIFHGQKLIQVDGRFRFEGAALPFPDRRSMARVPEGGWKNRDPDGLGTLGQFNDTYIAVLDGLQAAWTEVSSGLLTGAINDMRSLSDPGRTLMEVPIGEGPCCYGPDFVVP